MKRQKEVRHYIAVAEEAGWRVEKTKAGWRFLHPNGVDTVGMHRGTQDWRARLKTRCDFKRLGLTV